MMRLVAVLSIAFAVLVAVCTDHALSRQHSQTVTPSAPVATKISSRIFSPTPGDALQAVVIGDEFVSGFSSDGFGSKNWTFILQRLAAQSGIDVYVRNFGRRGAGYAATFPGIPTFGERVARGVNSDTNLVILVGGGNDKYSVPALHDAVIATLDRVRVIAPHAGVLIVGPIWCRPGPPDNSILPAHNVIRRAADESGIRFIDPIGEDWFAGRDDLVSPGNFHLNDAGHQFIAKRLAEPVITALRRQRMEEIKPSR